MNETVPLSGGKNLSEDAGLPLGTIVPSNLTPAGRISGWTDGELIRAIREGADPDGNLLAMMQSQNFRAFGDEDIKSIVAYIRSQPAVQNPTPDESLSVLTVLFAGAGMFPVRDLPSTQLPTQPREDPTAEYGEYIVEFGGCRECHGQELTGGPGGLYPLGPNLRVVKAWTAGQFMQTMRTGVNPTGRELDPAQMPWRSVGKLTDTELTALHAYLVSLE
ncbi:MAG: cytochrome c [SAR202 cluster bacterium]|nr:cytochrome c [SAR202 cluster bacterium]